MIITPKQYRENTKNCGVKTITGTVYDAHLFYANNRGRGKNNLTVCIVEKTLPVQRVLKTKRALSGRTRGPPSADYPILTHGNWRCYHDNHSKIIY